MRIFRFMSEEEFKVFLKGNKIEGKDHCVHDKVCFLEGKTPIIMKKQWNPNLKETNDFMKKIEEEKHLLPVFLEIVHKNGNQNVSPFEFISKVRNGVTSSILVQFETTNDFKYDKVVMAYTNYVISEIQADEYDKHSLKCISYILDFANKFKGKLDTNYLDTSEEFTFIGNDENGNSLDLQVLEDVQRKQNMLKLLPISSVKDGVVQSKLTNDVIRSETRKVEGILEIKKLIQKQASGAILTDEENSLINAYQKKTDEAQLAFKNR